MAFPFLPVKWPPYRDAAVRTPLHSMALVMSCLLGNGRPVSKIFYNLFFWVTQTGNSDALNRKRVVFIMTCFFFLS